MSFIFIYLFTRSRVTHAGLELYTVSGSPASTSRMLEYGVYYYAWFIQCWALELQVHQTRTLPTWPLPSPDTSFYKMHLQCFLIQEALPELRTSPALYYMNSLPVWLFGSCHFCPVSPEFYLPSKFQPINFTDCLSCDPNCRLQLEHSK